jgi:hypothetical protein
MNRCKHVLLRRSGKWLICARCKARKLIGSNRWRMYRR